ncbi:uncharacterized protein LOC128266239 [Drosophila gunungcola]|uniref:uncharacterized protein LOC128266239 n=1 Tax=Drosophila gunungcola TaxID=103775 RepID=UPI0022E1D12B|nr:uncharacterized protein LOC128266239 [Drosophila gunungcola]
MAQDPKWKKAYDRLVREHYEDQKQIYLLQSQLRHFRSKRKRLQREIEEESKGMDVWMDMMERLRCGMERFQKHKHLLTPKKNKQLRRMIRKLPMNTLKERVQLMELSEKLVPKPCNDGPVAKAKEVQNMPRYSVPLQKPCDAKTQSTVDKRLARIKADLQTLRHIHEQTMDVVGDIRAIMATTNYLQRGRCTNIKITPYVESKQDLSKSKKATIELDRLRRTKHKTHYTREIMDVRPPYILDHVPQLKPNIFDFLETKSRKKH